MKLPSGDLLMISVVSPQMKGQCPLKKDDILEDLDNLTWKKKALE